MPFSASLDSFDGLLDTWGQLELISDRGLHGGKEIRAYMGRASDHLQDVCLPSDLTIIDLSFPDNISCFLAFLNFCTRLGNQQAFIYAGG